MVHTPDPPAVVHLHPALVAKNPRVSIRAHDDDALMLLARGGRTEAFDTLVRRHQASVLRFAEKELGCPGLADDAAQNAFVEVYRYLPRYAPRGRFTVFLFRIVLNQCRMTHRANKSRERSYGRLALLPVEGPTPPDAEVLAGQRRRILHEALEGLRPKLRHVLLLRYAGELSYQQIADVLDIPLGTVKSRLCAGLQKLRDALDGGPLL